MMEQKILKNRFTFNENFLKTKLDGDKQIKKMGNLKDLLGMMPDE